MALTKSVRIISDGTRFGTKVLDAHGDLINGVTGISWSIKNNVLADAAVYLEAMCEVDISGTAHWSVYDPLSKAHREIRAIEFADGTRLEVADAPKHEPGFH